MTLPDPASLAGRRLVFVVTEDWFFASHFLPMARAARGLGLDVTVVCRVRDHRAALESEGLRVVALEAERRSLNPMAAGYAAGQLASILKALKADLVHCIALKGILVGGTAAAMAGVEPRVFAPTGLGLLGARQDLQGRGARLALRGLMRALSSKRTHYLFENPDDPRLLGLNPGAANVTLVGGAGIDPALLVPAPLPPQPPLRVAVVARMLWSKGIDVAVEAVRVARAKGAPVTLSLYGAPDPSNPRAISQAQLEAWSAEPGIFWHGPTGDVASVWRDHHVCCLPSRGGEGLPRSLLEGAACGRAILTTAVPGCRALVRDGVEGRLVPPDDAPALTEAMIQLAADPARVAAFGEAARARVLDGFTEAAVGRAVAGLYARLLAA
ncbi:MAG TPA: glycosyltransferase family 4 protein [Beijerinckiaceae bacterium]